MHDSGFRHTVHCALSAKRVKLFSTSKHMHMPIEGDDLAGERYMVNDDDEDYQHPQLETSKHLF